MTAPFLFVDNMRGAGACSCFRYVGATPNQLGNTFGSRYTSTTNPKTRPRHAAAQYRGNLYALAADGVYVKDDPSTATGTWSVAFAFTSPMLTLARNSGLHITVVNGAPILVAVIGDSTGNNRWRWVKYDGSSWTEEASAAFSEAISDVVEVIVYRNVLHILGTNGTNPAAMTFDPASNSYGQPTNPFAGLQNAAYSACIFNDRLLVAYFTGASGIRLAEFTGGSWVDLAGSDAGYTTVTMTPNNGKWALFTNGTNLYGLVPAATTDGWRCLRWDNTLGTPTDVTAATLPANLQSSTDGGTYANQVENGGWLACIDQDTDPLNPDIWLFFADEFQTNGTPWSIYKWNGDAALIGNAGLSTDVGGDVRHVPPTGMNHGGEHIFTAGELDALIVAKAAVFGGQQIQASFWGDAGAADKNVKLYYATEGEPTLQEATLTGTPSVLSGLAAAPTLNAGLNRLEGVEADDGASVYAFTWDLATDGISVGDRVQLFLRIFA